LWLAAGGTAIWQGWSIAGIGTSPAEVEAKVAEVSAPRTRQRLRVSEVLVSPGQAVKAGEILVRMDTSDIDAELAIAQARLHELELAARSQQVKLLDDHTRANQQFAVAAERAALDVSRISTEEERDRAELAQLEVAIVREQKLVGDQLANAQHLNELSVKRAALAKKVDEYALAVKQARKGASGTTQRLDQWKRVGKVGAPGEDSHLADRLAPAQAAVETQRQEVHHLELQRARHEIKAPFAGRVGEIFLQPGQISADPASPIVTVVGEQPKTAIAYVDQVKAPKIHVGAKVQLVPRDLDGPPLTGLVVAVGPSITEIPIRFRRVQNLHEYGRNVYIVLDTPAALPGQAFDAVIGRGPGGAP
jgi:multidrug resistance efflux pump